MDNGYAVRAAEERYRAVELKSRELAGSVAAE
jgi:hypothetical protein